MTQRETADCFHPEPLKTFLEDRYFWATHGRTHLDQLFVLTEILKSRVGMSTYAAFIDVKKAYDTVWRGTMEEIVG